MISGKVYGRVNLQKFASNKIRFLKILKINKKNFNPPIILLLFYNVFKDKMFANKMEL